MNYFFIEIFSNYTKNLDYLGGSFEQVICLSNEAFDELKTFIKQYDEWAKSLPNFPDSPDPEPLLPNLLIDRPFILRNGYRFNIKINEQ